MSMWKTILKKILFPHFAIILFLTVISVAGLGFVFLKELDTSPIAYVLYVVSFYTLSVLCLFFWKTLPKYYKGAKAKLHQNKHTNRYLTDREFKTRVNLYRSLIINLAYVLTNAISAFVYQTAWFGIFAVYYAIMAFMRFLLVRHVGRKGLGQDIIGELKRSRACACFLVSINLLLSGVVLMMIYFNRGFEYEGMLIYVMAAYTFYITTMSIIDIVRFRKRATPIVATSMIIRLTSAMMSMLFLETAMLSQFGADTSEEFHRIMITSTGAGISIVVVALSLCIMVYSTREIKKLKRKEATEEKLEVEIGEDNGK